jgi:hypothetical protein
MHSLLPPEHRFIWKKLEVPASSFQVEGIFLLFVMTNTKILRPFGSRVQLMKKDLGQDHRRNK